MKVRTFSFQALMSVVTLYDLTYGHREELAALVQMLTLERCFAQILTEVSLRKTQPILLREFPQFDGPEMDKARHGLLSIHRRYLNDPVVTFDDWLAEQALRLGMSLDVPIEVIGPPLPYIPRSK